MTDLEEVWLPAVGYEGLYEVSNHGRVRSLDRIDANGRRRKGRILLPVKNLKGGRLRVDLYRGGQKRMLLIHRLVLMTFVGPAPDGMEACHNDGNHTNNAPNNLRWDTSSANKLDSVRHGTHANAIKTHCPRSHPYDSVNTYIDSKGKRRCRACWRPQDA
ncbi:NUMOD4 motif-containing HNH endonuclease [Oerskovia enterophila]|uniref:NUMOD4 motif-containing HNH endonuclease n=1 Tax=Oerskovia enterophila TaxID=43678 RepID=UPI00380D129B